MCHSVIQTNSLMHAPSICMISNKKSHTRINPVSMCLGINTGCISYLCSSSCTIWYMRLFTRFARPCCGKNRKFYPVYKPRGSRLFARTLFRLTKRIFAAGKVPWYFRHIQPCERGVDNTCMRTARACEESGRHTHISKRTRTSITCRLCVTCLSS
jgi:hypothetical protein